MTMIKQQLAYLPLEPYKARYTELLSAKDGWAETAFAGSFALQRIEPAEGAQTTILTNGRVLDALNRPQWALEQTKLLLQTYPQGKVYLDDFFHPGVEAIPYSGRNYQVYSFLWAQTFDRYDFTAAMPWMRAYESMMFNFARKSFVASPLLQELILTAFPSLTEQQVPFVGLPFDSKAVKALYDPEMQPEQIDVVFSSRFDREKQPNFFLDIVEMLPDVKFAICTGHEQLKGNDFAAVARANALADSGKLMIYSNLTKKEYYSLLKASKVQFNCSLQDWVSFTLLEALSHGCIPCYPRFRDFNNVFETPDYLYNAWDRADAAGLLQVLLDSPKNAHEKMRTSILGFHDGTFGRIADHIRNDT